MCDSDKFSHELKQLCAKFDGKIKTSEMVEELQATKSRILFGEDYL